ncbi:MAG: hypothetical protein H6502_00230 [Candidatus Woesearchaeota archaeon]|nr:MAG: hypothetical protein H6502_00230 [Candidatus Woesearchaeota archaeon]
MVLAVFFVLFSFYTGLEPSDYVASPELTELRAPHTAAVPELPEIVEKPLTKESPLTAHVVGSSAPSTPIVLSFDAQTVQSFFYYSMFLFLFFTVGIMIAFVIHEDFRE